MKQTKPYGRAYLPPSAQETAPAEPPPPSPEHAAAEEEHNASRDLFSLTGETLVYRDAPATSSTLATLRQMTLQFVMVLALLLLFVTIRDSLFLARLLDQLSTEDTVMVCKDGKMYYPDYNPLDRLLGRGHFVCTDWKVQRGFLSIPKIHR